MKKITLLAFCILLSAFSLFAQQPQLSGSDFETGWKNNYGDNGTYEEFETDCFFTLNSLFAKKNEPKPADITAWKVGNAQQGNSCIKLVSGVIPVGEDVFLPGMVGTINQDFVEEFLGSGGNVTIYRDWLGNETPHAMEGWFKYNPVNGDSALIDIGFHKAGASEPLFVEKLILKETVNEWTHFYIAIPKEHWNTVFTDIRVLFVASAGVNFKQLMECKGQKGSTLWIDNVTLNYKEDGIKQNLFSSLTTKAFPNPANEVLNIKMNEHFNGTVTVYNIAGTKVMEEAVNGTECQLNTASLATGNYVFKLMNGNTIFAQGKFVITK
ncbi:MAG: T9SS type A sorting domain-containing protein [Lentimicrobiaceae bacterium]|nr:T9SS type A sorting domain-containing protein [Lentimicrobiaceae bacterium]